MAVKVMVAPAIVNGEVRSEVPARRKRRDPGAPGKPRRRSSVYDADGNEVFITLMCLKCHKMRPLGQFGLRRMADGAIRNQPWCRPCRSSRVVRPDEARGATVSADPTPAAESPGPDAAAGAKPVSASAIAAQVAAAIVWNK